MTALPRLQHALEECMAEPAARRRPAYRTLATVVVLAAATVAVWAIAARGPSDVEIPAAPRSDVEVGRPVVPAVPAGDPPKGRIELRAVAPNATLEALYFTDGDAPCLEVGESTAIRKYPVEEGGSCLDRAVADLPIPLTHGLSTGPDMPAVVSGFARPDVEAIEVDGRGGTSGVPISEHRAWFVSYPASARGRVVVTARLRDGSRHSVHVSVPPEAPPPLTEGPERVGDPVLPLIRPREAAVDEIALSPRTGDPMTMFELEVPPAPPRDLYAVSLDGPAGKDCRDRLGESFGVVADRKQGRIRPLPPHRQPPFQTIDTPDYDEALRTAPWCRGNYRLTVRYHRYRESGQGRTLARFTFTVE